MKLGRRKKQIKKRAKNFDEKQKKKREKSNDDLIKDLPLRWLSSGEEEEEPFFSGSMWSFEA